MIKRFWFECLVSNNKLKWIKLDKSKIIRVFAKNSIDAYNLLKESYLNVLVLRRIDLK